MLSYRAISRASLLLGALLLTAAGCGENPVAPTTSDVTEAKSAWDALALDTYTVEARVSCFVCVTWDTWHELTVVNDSVVSARPLESGIEQSEWHPFQTVDGAYRIILTSARALSESSFERSTGLPIHVGYGSVLDDFLFFRFRNLRAASID